MCQLSLHLSFLVRPGRRFLRYCGAFHLTLRQDGQTEREIENWGWTPPRATVGTCRTEKNKHEAYILIACLSIVHLRSVYGQHASRLWLLQRRMPTKGFSPSLPCHPLQLANSPAGEKSKRKSLPRKKEAKRRIRKRMRHKMSKRVQMRKQSSN